MISRRALVTTLALALATPSPALADKKRAYELYEQSKEKYRAGQFAEAAALLREAYANEPDPTLLYNLGRACEGMGDDRCAIEAYEQYLAKTSPPDRGAIEKKIATMRARLEAAKKPNEPPSPKEDAPKPAIESHGRSAWPWIVTGTGGALLGTGVVFVLLGRSAHASAVDEPVQETAAKKQDDAETQVRVGNVLLVAGAVVAAAGVAWFALTPSPSSPSVALSPTSVSLSIHF